jgi:hypothetical protein
MGFALQQGRICGAIERYLQDSEPLCNAATPESDHFLAAAK